MPKFNQNNGRARWACADPYTASLRVVPPGQSRRQLYCPDCPFSFKGPGCLWTPSSSYPKINNREGKHRDRTVRLRIQGLNSDGKPLGHNCWNCTSVRKNGTGYVCAHSPADPPASQGAMIKRSLKKTGCSRPFQLRRTTDIPFLVP